MKKLPTIILVFTLSCIPLAHAMEEKKEENYDNYTSKDLNEEIYNVLKELKNTEYDQYNQVVRMIETNQPISSPNALLIRELKQKYELLLTIRNIRIEEERLYDAQFHLQKIDTKKRKTALDKQRHTILYNKIEKIRKTLPAGRGNDYERYKKEGFIKQGITNHDAP
jgi:hypothetical protein